MILDGSLSKDIKDEDILEPEDPEIIADTEKSTLGFPNADLSLKNPSNMLTYSNNGSFFRHKSLSKVLFMEMEGIEPSSKNISNRLSTSVVSLI